MDCYVLCNNDKNGMTRNNKRLSYQKCKQPTGVSQSLFCILNLLVKMRRYMKMKFRAIRIRKKISFFYWGGKKEEIKLGCWKEIKKINPFLSFGLIRDQLRQKRVFYCKIIVISNVFNIFSLSEKFKLWRLLIIPTKLNSSLMIY